MGVLRPIVNRMQSKNGERSAPTSKRVLTLANLMTLSRPTVLGGYATYKMIRGKSPVWGLMVGAAASDMEGFPARIGDKIAPGSFFGTSEVGQRGDPVADTAFAAEACLGIMLSPRTSKLSKLAAGIILGQEVPKAAWAIRSDQKFKAASGEKLNIPPTMNGKESMAEKLVSMSFAAVTHDLEHPVLRFGAGVIATGFAMSGVLRARNEFNNVYKPQAEEMILLAQQTQQTAV